MGRAEEEAAGPALGGWVYMHAIEASVSESVCMCLSLSTCVFVYGCIRVCLYE